jgi:hypothetical protein
MARTRTAGIRIDSDGRRIIDKEHRGVGIISGSDQSVRKMLNNSWPMR